MSFSSLQLSQPILKALANLDYTQPTPIQEKAIPVILSGKNLIAAAQTGTGKTASFVLPILQKLNTERKLRGKRIRALILVPTRELAVQLEEPFSILPMQKFCDEIRDSTQGMIDWSVESRKARKSKA